MPGLGPSQQSCRPLTHAEQFWRVTSLPSASAGAGAAVAKAAERATTMTEKNFIFWASEEAGTPCVSSDVRGGKELLSLCFLPKSRRLV